MEIKNRIALYFTVVVLLTGCSSHRQTAVEVSPAPVVPRVASPQPQAPVADNLIEIGPLKDEGDFKIRPLDIEIKAGRPYLPVGAELISKEGKVSLKSVVKRLANIKGFSVSWADDVDQEQFVDVDIKPEDDYWDALENLLRQLDYFAEKDGETIVVKFKETKQYHLVMPFLEDNFQTTVGGNLLGGAEAAGKMKADIKMEGRMAKPLDFWKNVEENLTEIIERTERKEGTGGGRKATVSSEGYLIIDRPLGIITVTAPRKTHSQIKNYLENLEKEIYKQVIIEAKIIEVRLEDNTQLGIDWSGLINQTLGGFIEFGSDGKLYPFPYNKGFISRVTMEDKDFNILVKALRNQGDTKILSNPKISLLNGHGATITVGESVTYIDSVEKDVDETGDTSFSIRTETVLSGLGLAVMANILNDMECILYIVPVTSELQEPIEYKAFGAAGDLSEIGLPRVNLREMATYAKVDSGQTLIIGGLIDTVELEDETGTPILEKLPLLGRLFKVKKKEEIRRELVILLRPRIVSWKSQQRASY